MGLGCKNDFNSRCCRLSATQCETLLTVSELETLDVVQAVCLRSSETVICLRHRQMTFFQQHPKNYILHTLYWAVIGVKLMDIVEEKVFKKSFESNFCLVLPSVSNIADIFQNSDLEPT